MPNTNCLENIRCPECGSDEAFWITATSEFLHFDAGPEVHDGDVIWDNDSIIRCRACNHAGLVSDFTAEPPEHQAYREAARQQYGREGEIEIDDAAEVSHAHDHAPDAPCHSADDEGAYVQAWLWVHNPEGE